MANWTTETYYFGSVNQSEFIYHYEVFNRLDIKSTDHYLIDNVSTFGPTVRFYRSGRNGICPNLPKEFWEWAQQEVIIYEGTCDSMIFRDITINGDECYFDEQEIDHAAWYDVNDWKFHGRDEKEKLFMRDFYAALKIEKDEFRRKREAEIAAEGQQ